MQSTGEPPLSFEGSDSGLSELPPPNVLADAGAVALERSTFKETGSHSQRSLFAKPSALCALSLCPSLALWPSALKALDPLPVPKPPRRAKPIRRGTPNQAGAPPRGPPGGASAHPEPPPFGAEPRPGAPPSPFWRGASPLRRDSRGRKRCDPSEGRAPFGTQPYAQAGAARLVNQSRARGKAHSLG